MKEITDCCEKCAYYAELEHNWKLGVGYEKSHCCFLFAIHPYADKGKESILEVAPKDLCEMFVEKKQ